MTLPSEALPPVMKGVNAAVVTPLNEDLSVDLGKMYAYCQWLLENGCDGLGLLGTTGESTSFSASERMGIIEGLAKAGLPMEKTMPGTGSAAFTDTTEITRCAMDVGCGGVLMLPPFYYKGVSDEGLFNAYAEIFNRVNSNRLRVYLYHFPAMSSTPISHELIARLIADFPETVVGIKDSSGVRQNMLDMLEKFPGFAVMPGADTLFAEMMQAGAAGCITAVCNIASPLNQRVYAAWAERGEVDQEAQDLLTTIEDIISSYSYFSGVKTVLANQTGDDGWLRMRPPLCPLSASDRAGLLAKIKATGYEIPSFD